MSNVKKEIGFIQTEEKKVFKVTTVEPIEKPKNIFKQLLDIGNYLTLNKTLIQKIGLNETAVLSYLINQYNYFYDKKMLNESDEFYCLNEDIIKYLNISNRQLNYTKNFLIKNEIISVVKKGLPCKSFYKINDEKVSQIIFSQTTVVRLEEPERSDYSDHSDPTLIPILDQPILDLPKIDQERPSVESHTKCADREVIESLTDSRLAGDFKKLAYGIRSLSRSYDNEVVILNGTGSNIEDVDNDQQSTINRDKPKKIEQKIKIGFICATNKDDFMDLFADVLENKNRVKTEDDPIPPPDLHVEGSQLNEISVDGGITHEEEKVPPVEDIGDSIKALNEAVEKKEIDVSLLIEDGDVEDIFSKFMETNKDLIEKQEKANESDLQKQKGIKIIREIYNTHLLQHFGVQKIINKRIFGSEPLARKENVQYWNLVNRLYVENNIEFIKDFFKEAFAHPKIIKNDYMPSMIFCLYEEIKRKTIENTSIVNDDVWEHMQDVAKKISDKNRLGFKL